MLATADDDIDAPLRRQDSLIGEAAAASASRIRARGRRRGPMVWPLALAAGLAAGVLIGPQLLGPPAPDLTLRLPGDVTRGGDADNAVPVTQVDAGDWYRYIQELVYRGDFAEAERHLAAFNELHPKYRQGD